MIRKKTIPGTHLAGLMPAILISLLVHVGASVAAQPAPAAQYAIQQPAQSLADALRAISHETSTSVLFDPAVVRGRMAHAVSGNLTAFEALTAALEGTGLSAERMGDASFLVRPAAMPSATPASDVLASAGSATAELAAGDVVATADSKQDDTVKVARVEITGTRLKRINVEGPAPVNIYTAKDIEQSGQPTLERFLAGLNETSVSVGESTFGATLGQGTVQLRGLPLGTTLVLINGRRVEAVGTSQGNFFNLSLIPLAAIERVEIVPVGSSAVYGGDALAGVVNVILKKSIDGVSVQADLGAGRGFGDGSIALATGGHNADGSYVVLGSYKHSTALTEKERGFFVDVDYRRFGGEDARVPNCTPGNVSSVSGANLPGLSSSFAAIPKLASGQTAQISDFIATAGTTNLCDRYANGNGVALVLPEDTLSFHAAAEHLIGGSWYGFGEFTFARDRMRNHDNGLSIPDLTVTANNPFNPFGVDVQVTALLGPENGLQGVGRQTRFTRTLLGVRGTLVGDWETEATLSSSRDDSTQQNFN
ncbi:MAG: TonB-dependent receptor, partial [Polaromonas sp.]|nr:TonB-dependent receptor [Gemmatimonadaceae bacterium]